MAGFFVPFCACLSHCDHIRDNGSFEPFNIAVTFKKPKTET